MFTCVPFVPTHTAISLLARTHRSSAEEQCSQNLFELIHYFNITSEMSGCNKIHKSYPYIGQKLHIVTGKINFIYQNRKQNQRPRGTLKLFSSFVLSTDTQRKLAAPDHDSNALMHTFKKLHDFSCDFYSHLPEHLETLTRTQHSSETRNSEKKIIRTRKEPNLQKTPNFHRFALQFMPESIRKRRFFI